MRLAPATEVVSLLGVVANDGSEAHAQIALDVVTPLIEARLGTRLSLVSYQDYFDYSYSAYRKSFTPTLLRLTGGYIVDGSLSVRQSTTGDALTSDTDGEAVATTLYRIDPLRGVLTLLGDVTTGYGTLLVKYQAGFEAQNAQLSDETAPAWLKQAAIMAAVRLIQMNPTNLANKKVSVLGEIQHAVDDLLSTMLNTHIRPRMGLEWPARVVAVDE